MGRSLAFLYGVVSYFIFFGTFLYLIGFTGDLFVPKSVDSGVAGSLGKALLINAALVLLFAVQHTVMARQGFKKWWTNFVPWPVERSTFVLITSLILMLMYWQWQPMAGVIWQVDHPVAVKGIWALFWAGWGIVLLSTFMIDHFDLFGLKQVFNYFQKREHVDPAFYEPFFYKVVRHPLLVGFLIAFWAAPTMTTGRLYLGVLFTAYIFVGVRFEERDLLALHGDTYREYQKRVSRLCPMHFFKRGETPTQDQQAKAS